MKINRGTIDITCDEVGAMKFTDYQTTYATSTIWDLWARTDSSVWWARLNLLSAPDCTQNHVSGTRSLISSSSYLVLAKARTFDYHALGKDFSSEISFSHAHELRSRALPVRVPARYVVGVSPFFFSPRRVTRRRFANRHGKRTRTLRHCVACRRRLAWLPAEALSAGNQS